VWYVPYRIYRDAARLIPWGDTPTTSALGTIPLTGSVSLPVFGVADLKNVRASEYRDIVTVVLEF
jgi:spore coat protein U-like protein